MTSRHRLTFLLAAGLLCGASLWGATSVNAADHGEKVTLCHAAGRDGTDHFVTLTIGYQAAYGPGGHFNEDGTPRAGHEDDYLGPCVTDTTTTTVVDEPTTTVPPTTTTTVDEGTTTTVGSPTTTATVTAGGPTTLAEIGTPVMVERQELPRTGGSSIWLLFPAAALIAVGLVLLRHSRETA